MNIEHVHISGLERGVRPHLAEYLGRFIRQNGSFLLEDTQARLCLSNSDVASLLEREGVRGYLFLKGASMAGHLLTRKVRLPEGYEWQVLSVRTLSHIAQDERLFHTVLGHIGKTLFEEVWANNASLVRFMDGNEHHQMLLIERATRGTLPLYLGVKFHAGGDMTRLVIRKPA